MSFIIVVVARRAHAHKTYIARTGALPNQAQAPLSPFCCWQVACTAILNRPSCRTPLVAFLSPYFKPMDCQQPALSSPHRHYIPAMLRRLTKRWSQWALSGDVPSEPKSGHSASDTVATDSEKAQTYSRDLAEQHNTTILIHQLPHAVLQNIFANIEPGSYWTTLHYLHVCRLWRTLIIETPEVWARMANIVSHTGGAGWRGPVREHGLRIMLERCLQHSGTLPLTLRFTEFSRSVALLESHRDRIVSLTVKVRSDEDTAALQTLLAKGMPKLATLQLSSAYISLKWPQRRLRLEPKTLPNLRSLKIPGDLFDTRSEPGIVFSSLHKLELTMRTFQPPAGDPRDKDLGRYKALHASLQLCRELRKLEVGDGALPYNNLNDPSYHLARPIELPHLEQFTARDQHKPELISGLLAAVQCPPSTCFAFLDLPPGANMLTAPLPPFGTRGLFPVLHSADTLLLYTRPKTDSPSEARYQACGYRAGKLYVHWTVAPKTRNLKGASNSEMELCKDGRTPVRLAEELTHVFSAARTVKSLDVRVREFGVLEWGDLYRAFPELLRLHVTDSTSEHNALIALRPLAQPWGAGAPCVCPLMTELIYEWTAWSTSDALHTAVGAYAEKSASMLRDYVDALERELNLGLAQRQARGCVPLKTLVVAIAHLHPARPESAVLVTQLMAIAQEYLAVLLRRRYKGMNVYVGKAEILDRLLWKIPSLPPR